MEIITAEGKIRTCLIGKWFWVMICRGLSLRTFSDWACIFQQPWTVNRTLTEGGRKRKGYFRFKKKKPTLLSANKDNAK